MCYCTQGIWNWMVEQMCVSLNFLQIHFFFLRNSIPFTWLYFYLLCVSFLFLFNDSVVNNTTTCEHGMTQDVKMFSNHFSHWVHLISCKGYLLTLLALICHSNLFNFLLLLFTKWVSPLIFTVVMLPELGFMRSGAISSEDIMAQWFSVLSLRYSALAPVFQRSFNQTLLNVAPSKSWTFLIWEFFFSPLSLSRSFLEEVSS